MQLCVLLIFLSQFQLSTQKQKVESIEYFANLIEKWEILEGIFRPGNIIMSSDKLDQQTSLIAHF